MTAARNLPVKVIVISKCIKCYYDGKMRFSFSLDSDFIFGKNLPCQLFRLTFKNKSDFCQLKFSVSTVRHYLILSQSSCIERAGSRE